MDEIIRKKFLFTLLGFPGGTRGKESSCQCRGDARDTDSVPGSGNSPQIGNGNPLQYSCLGDPMDKGAWQSMGLQRVGHDQVSERTY